MQLHVGFLLVCICILCVEGNKKGQKFVSKILLKTILNKNGTKINTEMTKGMHNDNNIGTKKTYDDDDYDDDDNDDDDDDNDDNDNDLGDNGNFVGDPSSYRNSDDISQAEANLGHHYFQGDILSTKSQRKKLLRLLQHDSSGNLQNRALVKDVDKTWTNAMVPYTIKPGADSDQVTMVKNAIAHWESNTCLRFKPRTNENDYLQFERGPGCSSYVGRMGGEQTLTIGNEVHACKLGNIIHELGHTIGFFHEQSRPDRDDYVEIKWQNVLRPYRVNFVKFSKNVVNSRGSPYDYGSIMHYPRNIFGKDRNQETVKPKIADTYIGQRIALSEKDIQQAKMLYNCPK